MGSGGLNPVKWRWAAASEIGTAHLRLGTRKQDAMACFSTGADRALLCAIVCDGAGSAEYGGEGASVVCRTMTEATRAYFNLRSTKPDDETIWTWIDLARDRLATAAQGRGKVRRDFASTLVMFIAGHDEVLIIHVGDGAVVARRAGEGWSTLSPPENGEYASTTFFLTDDPLPRLRIQRFSEAFTAFAIFTDGIENFVLDYRSAEPHAPFFEPMLRPLDRVDEGGRHAKLSDALADFLSGPRVCEKTDDDKTLILISSQ